MVKKRIAMMVLLASSLAACGGGGGSSSPSDGPEPTPAPPPATDTGGGDNDTPEDDGMLTFTPEPLNVEYWRALVAAEPSFHFVDTSDAYQTPPNPDQCDPGVISTAFSGMVLEAVNETRALHGLAPVTYLESYDPEVAAAALYQHVNQTLTHNPNSSGTCYSQLAVDGSSTSNLSSNPRLSHPVGAVISWIDDSNNLNDVAGVGHRRLILAPELANIAYGQVEGKAALKVLGFTGPSNDVGTAGEFVASPSGDYPYILMPLGGSPTPWHIEMAEGSNFDFSDATITVSAVDTQDALSVDIQATRTDFASWFVADAEYDVEYTITIDDIGGDGAPFTIEYLAKLVHSEIADVSAPLESGDGSVDGRTASVRGNIDFLHDRDSHKVSLEGTVTVSGSTSRYSGMAYYVAVYSPENELVGEGAEPFVLEDLPAGDYTINVSLCSSYRVCYGETLDYLIAVE